MKEIRKLKQIKMRKILSCLQKSPKPFPKIVEFLYGDKATSSQKRNVQNYLSELKGIDVIEYDEDAKLYSIFGTTKQVYKNKLEYEMALSHSKELFLSNDVEQLFDLFDPYLMVYELTYNQQKYPLQISHLKTGYYNEIWTLIKNYLDIMNKTGLSNIKGYPKIRFYKHFGVEWEEPMHERRYPKADKGHVSITQISNIATRTEESTKEYCKKHGIPWQVPIITINEIKSIIDQLIGRLYSIIGDINHGIPLKGTCERCPNQRIIIND